MQLNYRGSAGYGAEHQIAGRREWGRNIQKDIVSGTRWAIGEGLAPADKVCIGGASFGAYSAVMSGIIEPALYRCIVASAGIYDLELLYKRGDIHAFHGGKNYIRRNIGEDADELRAFSPVHHVDRLAAPVLLAHGKKDRRAPYRHAADLRKALKKHNKPFEPMIERREEHGFYTAKNQVELARRTIEFVKRHTR